MFKDNDNDDIEVDEDEPKEEHKKVPPKKPHNFYYHTDQNLVDDNVDFQEVQDMQDQNRDEDIEYEYYNMNDDGDDVIRIFNSNKSHNQEIKTKKHNFFKKYEYQDYDDMGQKVIGVMPFLHFHLYLPRFSLSFFYLFQKPFPFALASSAWHSTSSGRLLSLLIPTMSI